MIQYLYSAEQLYSQNLIPLAKFSYLIRDKEQIFLVLVWAFKC